MKTFSVQGSGGGIGPMKTFSVQGSGGGIGPMERGVTFPSVGTVPADTDKAPRIMTAHMTPKKIGLAI